MYHPAPLLGFKGTHSLCFPMCCHASTQMWNYPQPKEAALPSVVSSPWAQTASDDWLTGIEDGYMHKGSPFASFETTVKPSPRVPYGIGKLKPVLPLCSLLLLPSVQLCFPHFSQMLFLSGRKTFSSMFLGSYGWSKIKLNGHDIDSGENEIQLCTSGAT